MHSSHRVEFQYVEEHEIPIMSSLDTRECLICTQDWTQHSIGIKQMDHHKVDFLPGSGQFPAHD